MKIYLFVINGFGVGSLPDYSKYESEYFCSVENLSCIEELDTFCKLGLKKCCLEHTGFKTIGQYFRARPLSTITSFKSGLDEILGNPTFDENVAKVENLVSLVKKHGINVWFSSSRQDSVAEKIFANDIKQLDEVVKLRFNKETLIIAELNDFAKFGLSGDTQQMLKAVKMYDNFFGDFLQNIKMDDVVFICGNFGVNPLKIAITREYSPIFVYSKLCSSSKNLKTIQGSSAIAMSIADLLEIYPNSNSIIDAKLRQKLNSFESILSNEVLATSFEKIVKFSGSIAQKKSAGLSNNVSEKSKRSSRKGFTKK